MGTYAMLLRVTERGRHILKDPARFMGQLEDAWTTIGDEVGVYLMLGEYDFLVIGTAPSADKVTALALALSEGGELTTSTVHMYTRDDVSKLPLIPTGGKLHFDD